MKITAEYPVKPNGVRECLQFIEQTLTRQKMPFRDVIEALLISEESLLLMEKAAPEDAVVQVIITRRIGVSRIRLVMPGTMISLGDHISTLSMDQLEDEMQKSIQGTILRSYADSIKYRHSRSTNILTIIAGIPERILTTRTVMGFVLALLTGVLIRLFSRETAGVWLMNNLLGPMETLFLAALTCITAPAVFISVTCSMFRFEGFTELGGSRKAVVASYFITSAIATMVGVLCFQIFTPGEPGMMSYWMLEGSGEKFSAVSVLSEMLPKNILEPIMTVNSLQLMVMAMIIGTAIIMGGSQVKRLKVLVEEMSVLCGKISSMVMTVVPFAVYCSTTNMILRSETAMFYAAGSLLMALLLGLILQLMVYCGLLGVVGRLHPGIFLKKYGPVMKSTLQKGSGAAAVPLTMRVCRRKLGVSQSMCAFSLPLGSSINMDGNCVCLAVSSLFFARICGVHLETEQAVILLIQILILSLGAPIAPGTLILCLVTLLSQMGIDTNAVSLIIGLNFILEMLMGVVNTAGDVVVALVVSRWEGSLDMDTYRRM